jgi:hypothetical protein
MRAVAGVDRRARAPARHDAGVVVLTNRVEPRGARSHSRVVRAWHVSTSQLTLAVRLGGAAAPLGVAINGPFARWRPSGPSPPWGRRCPIGRMRGQPFLGAPLSLLFSDKPSGSSHGRDPLALTPVDYSSRLPQPLCDSGNLPRSGRCAVPRFGRPDCPPVTGESTIPDCHPWLADGWCGRPLFLCSCLGLAWPPRRIPRSHLFPQTRPSPPRDLRLSQLGRKGSPPRTRCWGSSS